MRNHISLFICLGMTSFLLSGCYTYYHSASLAIPAQLNEAHGTSSSVTIFGLFGNAGRGKIEQAASESQIKTINRVEYERIMILGGAIMVNRTHVYGIQGTSFSQKNHTEKTKPTGDKKQPSNKGNGVKQVQNSKSSQISKPAKASQTNKTTAQKTVGILEVTSTQIGRVYIDGKYVGETNEKIKGIPAGAHKIEVRKARKAIATDSITIREKETSSTEIICKGLSKEATFRGGQREMSQYIIDNTHYPSSAAARGIKGVVIVSFIVSKTGSIQDVEITKSVDKSLDNEAIMLVKGMPKWEPAEIDGTPVCSFVSIPINFSD